MTRAVSLAVVILALAMVWILVMPVAPATQPIAFNHVKHSGLGCAVCHRGAETGERAGLPEASLCFKCHATAPRAVQPGVWDQAAKTGRIGWVRVTSVPDHVMFSHQRHVRIAGLECASCHADIGTRTTPPGRAPVRLNMDTCLSCHRREAASEDCAGCHR